MKKYKLIFSFITFMAHIVCHAQIISTFAGIGYSYGYSGDGGPATAALMQFPNGIAMDGSGNIYFADDGDSCVRKITPAGIITTFAGKGTGGDGGAATNARLYGPEGVCADAAGNVYISENSFRIRKVDAAGIITTFAGTGTNGYSGDGGPATAAQMRQPYSIAADGSGNVYLSTDNEVRKVNAAGIISTVAGNDTLGYSGDGGPATAAKFHWARGVAVDDTGNIYISDMFNNRIRKVNTAGIVTTVCGNGTYGYSGDGSPATDAEISDPYFIVLDKRCNIYLGDGPFIRKINTAGIITTIAGGDLYLYSMGVAGDGGPATAALIQAAGIVVDCPGNIYFTSPNYSCIRKITYINNAPYFAAGHNQPLLVAENAAPVSINAMLAVADPDDAQTETWAALTPPAHGTLAAAYSVVTNTGMLTPQGLYYTPVSGYTGTDSFKVVVTDCYGAADTTVVAVNVEPLPGGAGRIITTFAGNGSGSFSGEGGPATASHITHADDVVCDTLGNVYIACGNARIVKVTADGIIHTIAGTGTFGYSGDGGPATAANIGGPDYLAVDRSGNIYFTCFADSVIRKIDTSGIITTIAGSRYGFDGDGGPATAALLAYPGGLAFDSAGNIYVAANARIRKINTAGIISTIAGDGSGTYSGDGGLAIAAGFDLSGGLAIDGAGNIFCVSTGRIRKINISGIVSTIAGNGTFGFSGDGGPATAAQFMSPENLTTDNAGNIYIADENTNRVRKIDAAGIITTIAGSGPLGFIFPDDFAGDGCAATDARLSYPQGICIDAAGNIYIADGNHQRVRKITNNHPVSFTGGHSQSLAIMENAVAISVNAYLAIRDSDIAQPETWSTLTAPTHGTLHADTTMPSNGGIFTPQGMYYTPATGYSGTDSFRVVVTDCGGATDITTVHISVVPLPPPPGRIITTVAGNGIDAYVGMGGPATAASIGFVPFITADHSGNIYFSQVDGTSDYRVCKVNTSGIITTLAGNGIPGGYSGEGGPSTAASLGSAEGITVDNTGNVYFCDPTSERILKIDISGTISTFAGDGVGGSFEEGIPATAAHLSVPWAMALDTAGNIFFTDSNRIHKINTAGIISTIAGNGSTIISGDGGPAIAAGLGLGGGSIATDVMGNIFIACQNSVRKINPSGIITTIAGTGTCGFSGDGGPATAAQLCDVGGIGLDVNENIYVCDGGNHRIREINTAGIITTVAGIGPSSATWGTYSGDGCAATAAGLTGPGDGIAIDNSGNIYFGDALSYRVRKISNDHPVSFIRGHSQGLNVAVGVPVPYTVDSLLAIVDSDLAQQETWTVLTPPAYGLLNATAVLPSDGGVVTPSAMNYTPFGVYSGHDSFRVQVMDCAGSSDTTTVYVYGCASVAIAGDSLLCTGATIALGSYPPVGSWYSGNTAVATVSSSGIVTGVTSGTALITFSADSACMATKAVTVNLSPSGITGPVSLCTGNTAILNNAVAGGSWSSGNTIVAATGSSTGNVTAVSAGTAIVTYTLPTGCSSQAVVTVNPMPGPITGILTICTGSVTTLGNILAGGTWSSSNTAAATIDVSAGTLSGISTGTAGISYITTGGCAATVVVTVTHAPSAITGTMNVCPGFTTALHNTTAGGVWSSSNTGITTVDSASGIVTGVAQGVATISYTVGGVCIVTATVTVNPSPSAITGIAYVCTGLSTNLSDSATGGTWSSSNTGVAGINSLTGNVSGTVSGTSLITYTLPAGCYATIPVTVNPTPPAITGTPDVCQASSVTFHNVAAGGTWSSSSIATATIGTVSGIITGVSPGTATITYTLGTGCSTARDVTVEPIPAAITGSSYVCSGNTITLSNSTTGGVWGPVSSPVAYVDPASGVVTGASAGIATISYTLPSGCGVTHSVTDNALPSAIGGPLSICQGSTATLTNATGGTWASSNTTVATIGSATGLVNALNIGTSNITFTTPGGCNITAVLYVNALPAASTGIFNICAGSSTTLNNVGGTTGTWSSSNTTVATAGSITGLVNGITAGTTIITYTLYTGCKTTNVVTVDPLPVTITGSGSVCQGSSVALTEGVSGGGWSSADITVATVNSSGMVTGIAQGITAISYTLPAGCFIVKTITVNPIPAPVTGTGNLCLGSSTTLSDATAGGTWSSSNALIASVSGTGLCTAVSGGIAIITYKLPATGCQSTLTINSYTTPPAITGSPSLCMGYTTNLADAIPGGVWTSNETAIATIDGGGVVTGVALGTATISYTVAAGCATGVVVTVSTSPNNITGSSVVCEEYTTNLICTPGGGVWSSSNTAVTTAGTLSGVVGGVSAGTATISYTVSSTCVSATIVTVNPLPAPLSGAAHICLGSTTSLGDITPTGAWSSDSVAIATIDASGNVTGVAPGIVALSYTLPTGCARMAAMTINPLPAIISGLSNVCTGEAITLSSIGIGTWSSGNMPVAVVAGVIGTVTGIAPGTAIISFTANSTGCSRTKTVNVYQSPAPIAGPFNICTGGSTVLSDAEPGGIWSPTSGLIAFADAGTGTVTSVAVGMAAISYTLGNGCMAAAMVTVSTPPGAIIGDVSLCEGASGALTNAQPGGTWSSNNITVATIDLNTGLWTANAHGLAMITYSFPAGGCYSVKEVTVNAVPQPITGAHEVCIGAAVTLSSSSAGGTWSANSISYVSVGVTTGVISGITAGTSIVSYTLSPAIGMGCSTTFTITVDTVPAISGTPVVCEGGTTTFTNSAAGTWSSGNPDVATIGSTGAMTGVTAGNTIISYTTPVGCFVTKAVTVNPAPPSISGTQAVCLGQSATLLNGIAGGIWGSGNVSVATIETTSGVVLSYSAGTAAITYTLPTGCMSVAVVTVNALPLAITAPAIVCAGSTYTFSDAAGPGNWNSSNAAIASVSTSGVVTGITSGSTVISYAAPVTGCIASVNVSVQPLPAAVTGNPTLCLGQSATLSTTSTGGNWGSSNAAVAGISAAGIVTGNSLGIAAISYSAATGCSSVLNVTVNAMPSVITGSLAACAGTATVLNNVLTGGTWVSGNTAVAGIGYNTGIVTGNTGGTASITYSSTAGCMVSAIYTVQVAVPLDGAHAVCAGSTTLLSSVMPGGTWSSGNTAVAAVGLSSGSVSGIAAGVANITYAALIPGCMRIEQVTVNPLPVASAITGIASVCAGSATALYDLITDGTWSSDAPAIATAGSSGIITGITAGASNISYAVTNVCGTATAVRTVIVNPLPDAGTVAGSAAICAGSTITLVSSGSAAGEWTSGGTAIATVGTTGIVTGIAAGIAGISYVVANSCGTAYAVTSITVNTFPVAGTITGVSSLCAGNTTPLAVTVGSGAWSSGATSIATISPAGIVTGTAAGVTMVSYSVTNACGTAAAVHSMTINPLPVAGTILGTATLCEGASVVFTNLAAGGIWSSSAAGIAATGSASGVVNGIAPGAAIISYTVSNSCGAATTSQAVTIDPLPFAGVINGASMVCADTFVYLNNTTTGGVWSSGATGIASVSPAGGLLVKVSGISAGTAQVSYAVANGCGTAYALKTVTVNPLPFAGSITGNTVLCAGKTTPLADMATGGYWQSGNPAVAGVSIAGVVIGNAAGIAAISYTVANICGTAMTTHTLTVDPEPFAGAVSANVTTVCEGASITLTDTVTGGAWSSSLPAIATVNNGTVKAVAVGTVSISYAVSNSCGTATATKEITVNPLPDAGAITGTANMCPGATTLLSNIKTGGVWSSDSDTIAVAGNTGRIAGITAGTTAIHYTVSNSCGTAIATVVVTVNPLPDAGTITGNALLYPGDTTQLTDQSPGGYWSSSAPVIATIGSTGLLTAVRQGITTISYSIGNGCGHATAVLPITVQPGFTFYPNPSSGKITLQSAVAGKLIIYTLESKELQQIEIAEGINAITLPKTLAAGVYMCRFMGQDGSTVNVKLVYQP